MLSHFIYGTRHHRVRGLFNKTLHNQLVQQRLPVRPVAILLQL